jgi:16S rRNA (guanine(1405)-N(7))-methyltransferase
MNTITENEVMKLVEAVHSSRKYRELELPEEMLRDLIAVNLPNSRNMTELKTNFRTALHNVIAPYLEDIDYDKEINALHTDNPGLQQPENLEAYCLKMMAKHASTKERIPHLQEFFNTIFEIIGSPHSILDLACALDPLCLPWIKLSPGASFKAFDVNGPRIRYLQSFFALVYPNYQAIQQDILLHPPTETADCAFFFKEAHRLEKRQPGSTRILLNGINVSTVVLSLPAMDLKGHHSLENYHRHLVEKALEGTTWQQEVRLVGNELLFFIRKELAQ